MMRCSAMCRMAMRGWRPVPVPVVRRALHTCMRRASGRVRERVGGTFQPLFHSTLSVCKSGAVVECYSAEELEQAGSTVAEQCGVGDVLLLVGDLGLGKTCFARGFIRRLLGDEHLFVTSPSYLLDNTYETPDQVMIHHMDLYRLPNSFDPSILGIPDIFSSSICLIEWPDRLDSSVLSRARRIISVNMEIRDDQSRVIRVETK